VIFIVPIIKLLSQAYVLIVIASVLLSYFMDPYHPLRQGVDNLVRPLLDPIRKIVPPVGMLDFSPWVLIILVQVLSNFIIRFLIAIS